MHWTKLKDEIYYWDGSWRDIYIKNTTIEDWEKLVKYVNRNSQVNWHNGKTNMYESKINFEVIKEYWNGNSDLISTAQIYLGKIQINIHFFDQSEIENDIDPREFRSIEEHNVLVEYLKSVSKTLKKEVMLTLENNPEIILLKVNANKVKYISK